MAIDVHEEEQFEALRRWWDAYGRAVLAGLVLALALVLGWQWWQARQEARAEQASQLYAELLTRLDQASTAATQPGADAFAAVREPAERLLNDFAGTTYADLAGLALARVEVEGGEKDAARARLEYLSAQADDEALRALARLRLARLAWDMGDAGLALQELGKGLPEVFRAEADTLRGDVLVSQGRLDEARQAYDAALTQAARLGLDTGLIRIKRDDLGGGVDDAAEQAN